MNTQDNHYTNYFHQRIMIIKEQNQKEKIPFSNEFKIRVRSSTMPGHNPPTVNPTP